MNAILSGNGEVLDRTAQQVADAMVEAGVTPTQVRNLYSYIRRMHHYESYPLWMFRPRLAYAVSRHPGLRALQEPLLNVLDGVKSPEQFRRFQDFFEAILAYHAVKSAEGKGERRRGQ